MAKQSEALKRRLKKALNYPPSKPYKVPPKRVRERSDNEIELEYERKHPGSRPATKDEILQALQVASRSKQKPDIGPPRPAKPRKPRKDPRDYRRILVFGPLLGSYLNKHFRFGGGIPTRKK